MDTNRKVKMCVTMDVTIPQALALEAMFNTWNQFAMRGHSGTVGFFVDGDGNFHPHCDISYSDLIPPLTDEMRVAAQMDETECEVAFDFDGIAWMVREL